MERTLKLERLYPLAQYANIKFVDEIINLPEEVVTNEELVNEIRYLQMLSVEAAYRRYSGLHDSLSEKEEGYLEEEQVNTIQKIATLFKNIHKEI